VRVFALSIRVNPTRRERGWRRRRGRSLFKGTQRRVNPSLDQRNERKRYKYNPKGEPQCVETLVRVGGGRGRVRVRLG